MDYIIGNIFHRERDRKKLKGRDGSNQSCTCTLFNKFILAFVSSDINI